MYFQDPLAEKKKFRVGGEGGQNGGSAGAMLTPNELVFTFGDYRRIHTLTNSLILTQTGFVICPVHML